MGHAHPGFPTGRDQEPLIVNVFGSASGALFTYVSYTSVLEGHPVYDRVRDRWEAAEQFFRGRIVFLDALGQPTYDTPTGQLTTTELLAMATDNLLTGNQLLPPPRRWQFLLTLVVGSLMSSVSIRRSPLRGAWRRGDGGAARPPGTASLVAALYTDFYRQLANPDDREDLMRIVIGHQGLDAP